MTPPHKHACQLTSSAGRVCYLIKDHPGRVHVDVTDGGLIVWSLPDEKPFENDTQVPADPLQDAPEALRPVTLIDWNALAKTPRGFA